MKEGNREAVCAVVVTYNRKNLLLECLEALRKQTRSIQGIYLIDNASSDGTPELLLEKGYIKELPPRDLKEPWEKEFEIKSLINGQSIKFHYIRMYENTGGAGGFHEGVKRAYKKGYDWIWLMDDDAIPHTECLRNLLTNLRFCKAKVAAPVVYGPNGDEDFSHRGFIEITKFSFRKKKYSSKSKDCYSVTFTSFVGPIFKREVIQEVGLPKKEFFIHHDDLEYSIRIRKFKILLCRKAKILHKEISHEKKKLSFLGIKFGYPPAEDKFWLAYYSPRNYIFLCKTYASNLLAFKEACKILIKEALRVVMFPKYYIRLVFFLKAILDGFRGNFDNEYPKSWRKFK